MSSGSEGAEPAGQAFQVLVGDLLFCVTTTASPPAWTPRGRHRLAGADTRLFLCLALGRAGADLFFDDDGKRSHRPRTEAEDPRDEPARRRLHGFARGQRQGMIVRTSGNLYRIEE